MSDAGRRWDQETSKAGENSTGHFETWLLQKTTPWSWSSSWKSSWEEIGRKLNRRGRSPKKQKRLWNWQGRCCALHVVGLIVDLLKTLQMLGWCWFVGSETLFVSFEGRHGMDVISPPNSPTHPILTMSCGYLPARRFLVVGGRGYFV